jgi:hypothetical protein
MMDDNRDWKSQVATRVRYTCLGGDGDYDRPHKVIVESDMRGTFRFRAVCPIHGYPLNLSDAEVLLD